MHVYDEIAREIRLHCCKKIRFSCFIVVRCQLKSLCFLYRTDLVQQLEGQLVPK